LRDEKCAFVQETKINTNAVLTVQALAYYIESGLHAQLLQGTEDIKDWTPFVHPSGVLVLID
jgi:hypothetical protein